MLAVWVSGAARRAGVLVGTVLLVTVAVSRLVAPGPPGFIVEPSTGMVLVAIAPGSFVMGSPPGEPGHGDDEQPHRVTLSRRFYIGRFEVTQTEWLMVMGENPSRFTSCGRCPVEQVTFYDVDEFLSLLNARSTSMRFRLPTEAEWEYACRAGTISPFSTGVSLEPSQAGIASGPVGDNASPGDGRDGTQPAGSFPPNAWGLHDMHGNVWEWTNDWYGLYDTRADVDPPGAAAGTRRVIRGGSWYFDARSARCGLRYTHDPQDRGFSLGFRVVGEPFTRPR